jgi:hypothetical protein
MPWAKTGMHRHHLLCHEKQVTRHKRASLARGYSLLLQAAYLHVRPWLGWRC